MSAMLDALSEKARSAAIGIREPKDLQPVIDRLARARVVMLGEATHGTHEFYEWRRIISEWLMVKHGFDFIAVEGDWPDAARINSYIKSDRREHAPGARAVLEGQRRWPTWMWANTEVVRLMEWMREHNRLKPYEMRAGFFGLDLYSLFASIEEVLGYLDRTNPMLARRARIRYQCFDRFERDEFAYARSTLNLPETCEEAVIKSLKDLLDMSHHVAGLPERARDELFFAQENARVVKDAERYYRSMVRADDHSWNIRDEHMMDTLERLLERHGPESKAIIWAHNTHVGDYHATPMGSQGLINLGGLARARLGRDAVALVGFGTYGGSVIASHSWDGPIQELEVPPARSDSYEHVFHEAAVHLKAPTLGYVFDDGSRGDPFATVRGHRAIGVVYDPAHERSSNYVPTELSRRYDAFLFCDRTRALSPLILPFERGAFPETYPSGQ